MTKILFPAYWRRLAQGSFLVLVVHLLSTGGAWAQAAQCNVILSAILPGNQAVLKADCGSANMASITWKIDGNVIGTYSFPATVADLNFSALLTSGTHSYTASGVDSNNAPVVAGKAAVVTLSQPNLTVAASAGGTVESTPSGNTAPPGIAACTNSSGVCVTNYASGTTVTLTATHDSTHSFSGWGGDCSSTTNVCTVSMTAAHTVTATFGAQPTAGVCASPGSSSSAPTNLCTTGTGSTPTASNNTWNWTCAGPNNGSTTSCSAPQTVDGACGSANGTTPLNTPPSGTAACSAGNVASMTTGSTTFTWSCNGVNGGRNVTTCSAPITPTNGACGSANGGNVASAPTGLAACSAGASTTPTNPSNTFSWTCNGLAGGSSQACTANQIANGACGSSNGGSFSSAPSTGLCGDGSSPAVSLSGTTFSWTCSGINTGNPASCSASLSSTNVANCNAAAGETFGAVDLNWSQMVLSGLFPIPPTSGSGSAGRAIQFVADGTTYPNGIVLKTIDESGSNVAQPKEVVISTCPHNFNPVGGNAACRNAGNISAFNMYLYYSTNPSPARFYDCQLQAGSTYYVNFRQYPAGGSVSAQFGAGQR